MKLLALSGSLRRLSHNTVAVKALKILASTHAEVTIGNIGDLPLFNPDREGEDIPALATLKLALEASDGLVISSPEYAHGISGPLKNALDWLVSGSEFPDIPIMLMNTSPRARHAQDALREVVTTMSGRVIEKAYVSISLLGTELDAQGIIEHPEMSTVIQNGLNEFYLAIESKL